MKSYLDFLYPTQLLDPKPDLTRCGSGRVAKISTRILAGSGRVDPSNQPDPEFYQVYFGESNNFLFDILEELLSLLLSLFFIFFHFLQY